MDIVIVTYNSQKWVDRCIESIENANKTMNSLNLFVIDNASDDETCRMLYDKQKKSGLEEFYILTQRSNLGFGKANNIGASYGKDEIICFLNIDTEVYPDTFINLQREIEQSLPCVAAWEMRQLPYEHPKIYNPVTGETSWMTGAAFAVKRDVFEKVGGFDEKIFMYAEDVDLSWRIRAQGFEIKYCPTVKLQHYSYQVKGEVKPLQYVYSVVNNLLLRYRYGTLQDILKGHMQYWFIIFFHGEPYVTAKKQLLKAYFEHWKKMSYFRSSRCNDKRIANFLGWDYEIVRDGSFLENIEMMAKPKVSIIVRTCQRPEVLREALVSIRNQTYKNIEIVVVEDGSPKAEKMICRDFSDLDIKYYATEKKQGRSYAGNLGLEKSTGKYLNFLDDDDLFFYDHVEILVQELEKHSAKAAYAFGFETPVVIESTEPYVYCVKKYNKRYQREFDECELCYHNYIPIQCIMFSRELYERFGGFDTNLDYLEDWDLWMRYSQAGAFRCVKKTTSLYKIPFENQTQKERQKKLDDALLEVREKQKLYQIPVSASVLAKYGKRIMREKK